MIQSIKIHSSIIIRQEYNPGRCYCFLYKNYKLPLQEGVQYHPGLLFHNTPSKECQYEITKLSLNKWLHGLTSTITVCSITSTLLLLRLLLLRLCTNPTTPTPTTMYQPYYSYHNIYI